MYRPPTIQEMREALTLGLIPCGPYRCRNCGKWLASHSGSALYCPGEVVYTVKRGTPPPACECRTVNGKPLYEGQLHEPGCNLRAQNASPVVISPRISDGVS